MDTEIHTLTHFVISIDHISAAEVQSTAARP